MKTCKVHADEIDINFHLVYKLLMTQFPDWANLELQLIRPEGTDNVMYKFGSDKVIRLPRTEESARILIKSLNGYHILRHCFQ